MSGEGTDVDLERKSTSVPSFGVQEKSGLVLLLLDIVWDRLHF
ncbi:MAG: hypothetical protein P4L49_14350 [Desulfosporosinus sp.]|nr:hypothetical protein [Desulfosporosinus sp.]